MSLPEPVRADHPGALFLSEIREQPSALRRLLEHDAQFASVADASAERGRLVRFVGHGSSDNAATYGVYAFGVLAGWTALRDSIALSVYFDARREMAGSTVIGLSQSGQTPDVIEYVRREERQRGHLVQVRLRRGDGALVARAERQHRLRLLRQLRAGVVRDGDGEGAAAPRVAQVFDDVRRPA